MLRVNGNNYTLSEVVQLIKSNNDTPWREQYLNYLMKIDRPGLINFPSYADLIMKLANYVMQERGLSHQQLAIHRGNGPTAYSAMVLPPINRNSVLQADRQAIANFMVHGSLGLGTAHQTDPETGGPKPRDVTVTEFYVNGADGRRATKRTERNKITYYYSDTHQYNIYKYARLL